MKRYWLCKTDIFIDLCAGKIYLETEHGLIDDTGRPSQTSDDFRYHEHFEEISFNNYLKLLQ